MAKNEPKQMEFGDYVIHGHIAEGGMCHVFRARKRGEFADIALKLLKEELRSDDRMVDHFVTEADISMMVSHPNLIRTYEVGEHSGRHFIAMELIEGISLKQLIAECELRSLTIPPDFTLFILNEVLEGLQAVHSAKSRTGRPLGLVHRDVTPHNVFLGYDGRVSLGDFGIAQITSHGDMEVGGALGKIGYLSPEAVMGEDLDQRSDLFSIAIILYEMLTRTTLFDESTDEATLAAIADARSIRPRKINPSLSRTLEAEILRGLARRPRDRFQTAEEMLLALEGFWSSVIGNPRSLAAFLAGIFREEFTAWRRRLNAIQTGDLPQFQKR